MKAGFGGAVRLVWDLAGVVGCLSGGELSVPGRTQAEASHTHTGLLRGPRGVDSYVLSGP